MFLHFTYHNSLSYLILFEWGLFSYGQLTRPQSVDQLSLLLNSLRVLTKRPSHQTRHEPLLFEFGYPCCFPRPPTYLCISTCLYPKPFYLPDAHTDICWTKLTLQSSFFWKKANTNQYIFFLHVHEF